MEDENYDKLWKMMIRSMMPMLNISPAECSAVVKVIQRQSNIPKFQYTAGGQRLVPQINQKVAQ
jgi:hypothetical protein